MAMRSIATARSASKGGRALSWLARAGVLALSLAASFALPEAATAAGRVRITRLTDLAFGTVNNLGVDAVLSESLCVYSTSPGNGYHVTASGTGAGGAFALSSGISSLSYDVAWSSSSGQTSGALLSPNVALTGQVSSAVQQTCNSGPATTASLIVILRAAALSSATAGSYSGTLTIVVGPE